MQYRLATSSDKDGILAFCKDTFSWGDYIDQVWDIWQNDPEGRLIVANTSQLEGNSTNSVPVALCHAAICSRGKMVWMEGIRVRPEFRREKIASNLIKEMTRYGRDRKVLHAGAIVSIENTASQKLFTASNFSIISTWSYYSTFTLSSLIPRYSFVKLALDKDIESIIKFLDDSKIYIRSGRRYVNSWRWYFLDREAITEFIKNNKVIIHKNDNKINGLAIINRNGYWTKKSILQIIYIDWSSVEALKQLVSFALAFYAEGNKNALKGSDSKLPSLSLKISDIDTFSPSKILPGRPNEFTRFQLLGCKTDELDAVMSELGIRESEQFLLYQKDL